MFVFCLLSFFVCVVTRVFSVSDKSCAFFSVYFSNSLSNTNFEANDLMLESVASFARSNITLTLAVPRADERAATRLFPAARLQTFDVDATLPWVQKVNVLQMKYLAAAVSPTIYVELDMVATSTVNRLCKFAARREADIAYAYRGMRPSGSINTGVVIFPNPSRTQQWYELLISETDRVIRANNEGMVSWGGENQVAIDRLLLLGQYDRINFKGTRIRRLASALLQAEVPEGVLQAAQWCKLHRAETATPLIHFKGRPKNRFRACEFDLP